jgi:hypothetical protein
MARAEDFTILGVIPNALPEGVTIDAQGNVYGAEVIPRNLKKFAPIR